MTPDEAPVITIDGASGTGKGTVARWLAKHLGWNFLDSGALYRTLALAASKHSVMRDNSVALEVLAEHFDVQFPMKNNTSQVILEGEEVTEAIRTEAVGNEASIIAAFPDVRQALLARQRAFRHPPGLVADGRDMGTIVFPEATLKIFLLASLSIRALRRYNQLKEQNLNVNLSDLVEELRIRDERDQGRTVAPLKPAEDAILIQTDYLSMEEVISRVLTEFNTLRVSKEE